MVKTKSELKRWLISSLITFLAGFFGALGHSLILLDTQALEGLTWGVVSGLVLMAVRTGFKALWEKLVPKK